MKIFACAQDVRVKEVIIKSASQTLIAFHRVHVYPTDVVARVEDMELLTSHA